MHNDNASAHTSMPVLEFLGENKTIITTQLSYSSYLAPADFFLFPKLKTVMKEKRFATIEEMKKNLNKSCWRYQKADFRSVLKIGKNRWHKYIISEGGYFEGDKIV